MNKNGKSCIGSGTRVSTAINRVRLYQFNERIQCPSLVETLYINVEKLPQSRKDRLYRIIEFYLGYEVPDGISEVFGIADKWTIKWLWDSHEPVVISHDEVNKIGQMLDAQAERTWEVA